MPNEHEVLIRASAQTADLKSGFTAAGEVAKTELGRMGAAALEMQRDMLRAFNGVERETKQTREAMVQSAEQINRALERMGSEAQRSGRTVGDSMRRSARETRQATDEQIDHVGRLRGEWQSARTAIMGAVALIGGTALFRGAIDSTLEWTFAVSELAQRFGITTEAASALMVTAKNQNIETGTLINAQKALTLTLVSQKENYKALGIDIDALRARHASWLEVLFVVLDKMREFRAGTEQQAAAAEILKRSLGSLPELLRLNRDAFAEGQQGAKDFGLELSGPGVAAGMAYDDMLDDLSHAALAVKLAVADELRPGVKSLHDAIIDLTRSGELQTWAREGVALVRLLGEGMLSTGSFLIEHASLVHLAAGAWVAYKGAQIGAAAWAMLTTAISGVTAAVAVLRDGMLLLAMAEAAASGGITLLVQAAGAITALVGFEALIRKIQQSASGAADELARMKREQAGIKSPTGPMAAHGTGDPMADLLGQAAQAQGGDAAAPAGKTDRDAAARAAKEAQRQQLEDMKRAAEIEVATSDGTAAARLQIAQNLAEQMRQTFGEESDAYKAQAVEVVKAEQAAADERMRIALVELQSRQRVGLQQLEDERARIEAQQSMGEISGLEAMNQLHALEDARHALIVENIESERTIREAAGEEAAALNARLVEEAQTHQTNLVALTRESVQTMQASLAGIFDAGAQAVDRSVQGYVQGTLTLQKAVRQMGSAVVAEFVSMGVRTLATWVRMLAAKVLAATIADDAIMTSAIATSATKTAVEATSAKKSVYASAASAAGKAADAVADIPYVGPILAAVNYGVVYALVVGGLSAISARGGAEDIPSDGTLGILHAREMVLPASVAEPIRQMARGASAAASGGSTRAGWSTGEAFGAGGAGAGVTVSGVSPVGQRDLSVRGAFADALRPGMVAAASDLARRVGEGGGGTVQHHHRYEIHAVDAASFRALVERHPDVIGQAAVRHVERQNGARDRRA